MTPLAKTVALYLIAAIAFIVAAGAGRAPVASNPSAERNVALPLDYAPQCHPLPSFGVIERAGMCRPAVTANCDFELVNRARRPLGG